MKSTPGSVRDLVRGHRGRVALISGASLAGGLCEAAFLVMVTRSAFAISEGRESFGVLAGRDLTVGQVVGLATVLVLARVALSLVSAYLSASLSAAVTASLRRDIAAAYLAADWSTQQDDATGELQDVLTAFTNAGNAIIRAFTAALTAALNLVALLGFAVLVDPPAALVTIVAVLVLAAAIRPVRRRVRHEANAAAQAGIAYASAVSEISAMAMELHVFDVQRATGERIDELVDQRARIDRRLAFLGGLVPTMYTGLAYLAVLLALAVIAAADQADLRSVGAVMLVMLRSLTYGQSLQSNLTSLAGSQPFIEELARRHERYRVGHRHRGTLDVGRVGTLELRDVSFGYRDDAPVLVDVDQCFEPGTVTGLVGPSGSGKSTLVQLLLGLRSPTSGCVLSAGRDIATLSGEQWARKVTFVPQQPRLVTGSIADNIRFFREGVSDADIDAAVQRAHLADDVASWPEGLDRQVGDAGSRLSGGQQQRVCLARALVEDPDVLILDEPTSALDAESERRVRDTLAELRGSVTLIIVAHRPATLEICDRVVTVVGRTARTT